MILLLKNWVKWWQLNTLHYFQNFASITLESKKMKSKDLPKCPIETTLKMLGCKWKVLIIRELLTGTKRFCELKKSVTGITQKVLTSKLREMEELGLLERKVYDQTPPKVEYTLTDIGYSLREVLEILKTWGKDYKKYLKLIEKLKTD